MENAVTTLTEIADTSSRIKVADVVIADDDLGVNELSVVGEHAAAFELDGMVLYLKAGTVLDYESVSQYHVTIRVDDSTVGESPDAVQNFTLSITDANDVPMIAGLVANQRVNDSATIQPFAAISVVDPDHQNMFARVTIHNGVVRGDFAAASTVSWTRKVVGNNILYERFYLPQSNIGGVVQAAVRSFEFVPRSNAIRPTTVEATDIKLFVSDGIANTTAATRIVTTSVNDAPAISGAGFDQPVSDNATILPFSTMTISDADMQEMLIGVTMLNGKFRGDFTPASVAGWARSTLGNNITYMRYFSPQSHVGAAAQTAIRALVFQSRTNAIKPNTTELTDFQVTVSDGVAPSIAHAGTRVRTTSVNNSPAIGGANNAVAIAIGT